MGAKHRFAEASNMHYSMSSAGLVADPVAARYGSVRYRNTPSGRREPVSVIFETETPSAAPRRTTRPDDGNADTLFTHPPSSGAQRPPSTAPGRGSKTTTASSPTPSAPQSAPAPPVRPAASSEPERHKRKRLHPGGVVLAWLAMVATIVQILTASVVLIMVAVLIATLLLPLIRRTGTDTASASRR
jgi:hypothetical protein